MTLRKLSLFSIPLAILFMFSSQAGADVPMWYIEEMQNNQVVLEPGTTTYCNKDFHVENLGSEQAEIQVIIGNGANYSFDQLEPKGKKSYSLTADHGFTGGWDTAKASHASDARIINSTGGDSKILVYCE